MRSTLGKWGDTLKKIFRKANGQEEVQTPQNMSATFELKYRSLLIGTLTLQEGIWEFSYSEDFKEQDKIEPLVNFPKKEKVYSNSYLFPFFMKRIPGLKQPRVQERIKREKIEGTNEAVLLKTFGKVSITNPFILQAI